METELKDRAEKAQLLPPGVSHEKQPYNQQPQVMVYQEPIKAPQYEHEHEQTVIVHPLPAKGQQANH